MKGQLIIGFDQVVDFSSATSGQVLCVCEWLRMCAGDG